jgi:hypothetical protein
MLNNMDPPPPPPQQKQITAKCYKDKNIPFKLYRLK